MTSERLVAKRWVKVLRRRHIAKAMHSNVRLPQYLRHERAKAKDRAWEATIKAARAAAAPAPVKRDPKPKGFFGKVVGIRRLFSPRKV